MALALAFGRRGMGKVSPWPSVGCVIVKDGRVVGRGRSDKLAGHHAEVGALNMAGDQAMGATAYVTLEPCSHQGSTPPCAEALISAGIARVVSAIEDPNPLVCGSGHAKLKAAGIEVTTGVMASDATKDHAGFLSVQTLDRPMLTLKLAASIDGRIATASGESKWITGPDARKMVHLLRYQHDAVLVGAGTARADDPELNVRGYGDVPQPVRIVASKNLDLPLDCKLVKSAQNSPVWLVHDAGVSAEAFENAGAVSVPVAVGADRRLAPLAMLSEFAKLGLTRVFCEGGGTFAASLLQANVVDRLVVFHAGMGIGAEGTPALGAMGLDSLGDAVRFDLADTVQIGQDVMSTWLRREDTSP